jgi:hypothetical protein
VGNLGRQAERVCVTWSIFKLKNTSGVNYIFILGRSSVAILRWRRAVSQKQGGMPVCKGNSSV